MKRPNYRLIAMSLLLVLPGSLIVYGGTSLLEDYREIRCEKGTLTAHVLTTGRVQPENRIDIKAPIPGRAEEILVKEGDYVERGQILMWMSSSERSALLDAAEAKSLKERRRWEKSLPATPVIAPVAGRIIQRNLQPGQTFTEADPVFVMANRLVIEAPVDETDLARLRVGQRAVTLLDADPSNPISSHVASVAFDARQENNVTMYMAQVALDDVSELIRVGMTANVNFELETKHDVVILPSEALRSEGGDLYVYTPPENGRTPNKVVVKTGISDGRRVEILEGLKAGDIVLVPLQAQPKERRSSYALFD